MSREMWAAVAAGELILTAMPCGDEITGWTIDNDVREVEELEPLWEGGPLMPAGRTRLESFGQTMTVLPCGHVAEAIQARRM